MFSRFIPEYENEEHKETKEDSHIVHGAKHNHQLAPQVWQEPNQFEYSEESEGSEDGYSRSLRLDAVH